MTRSVGVLMLARFGRLRGWTGSVFVSRLMRLFVTAWSEEAEVLIVLLIGVAVSMMLLLEMLNPRYVPMVDEDLGK